MKKQLAEYKKVEAVLKFYNDTQKKEKLLLAALSPTTKAILGGLLGEAFGRTAASLLAPPQLAAKEEVKLLPAKTSTYNTVSKVMRDVMASLNMSLGRGCTVNELYEALQKQAHRDRAHIPTLGTVKAYLHSFRNKLWRKVGTMPHGGRGAYFATYAAI